MGIQMAWTQADLDRIDAAIARPELLVAYDSGKVRYKDQLDLIKARRLIYNSIQLEAGKDVPCLTVCSLSPGSNL